MCNNALIDTMETQSFILNGSFFLQTEHATFFVRFRLNYFLCIFRRREIIKTEVVFFIIILSSDTNLNMVILLKYFFIFAPL